MLGVADLAPGDSSKFTFEEAFKFTSKYLVAGLTSPGRVRPELDNRGFFVSRGEGAYLYDIEGRKYVDLNCGHGASLIGHSHPEIMAALRRGLDLGTLCGQETVYPARVARRLVEMVPSAELVRFTLTGTAATGLAVKVARGFTGRKKVIKFEGHYHGHNDALQFSIHPPFEKMGPRTSPHVISASTGVLPEVSRAVCVLPWNDLDILADLLKREADRTAAVIMEPINLNSGGIMPRKGYLEGVRELTKKNGILLIFDEILSGFRTGPGCAQSTLGVTPDLTTLGKAIGGGMPIAALVGKREVMEALAPVGKVMNSGTFYGQVLVMQAAEAFLKIANDPVNWEYQGKIARQLYDGMGELFDRYGVGLIKPVGNRFGMLFGLDEDIHEYRDLARVDKDLAFRFFKESFKHGVYFAHAWHHGFSWVHTERDIHNALQGIEDTLKAIVK